jgi:hypothetical protein
MLAGLSAHVQRPSSPVMHKVIRAHIPALSAAARSSSASRAPSEMHKPMFTETMQIGIVVRDLDAAVRRYVDDYGIGPWEFYQFKPGDAKVWLEHGQPARPSTRIATAMVGREQWELIQPLQPENEDLLRAGEAA